MDDLRIPLQRPAPASDVAPLDGATSEARQSGWCRVLAVSFSRSALALVLGLVVWSVLPLVVGWTPRTIMSGSMEPRLHVGDVVVGRPVDPSTLVTGQIVTVVDPDHPAKTRTHRLLRRDAQGRLVLKGDANPQADSTPVLPANVLGVGAVRVPYVARPAYWMAEGAYVPLGLTALALVALGLTAASPLHLAPPAPRPGPAVPAGPSGPQGPDDHDPDHDATQDDEDADQDPDSDRDSGRDAGLGILQPPVPATGALASGLPDQDRRRGTAASVRPAPGRSRWALLGAVVAGLAALCLVAAAPTQSAYAVTTGTPRNTWSAAASFSSYRATVLADTPLIYWRLDSASGPTADDLSGHASSGTLSGTYAWGRSGALVNEPSSTALGLTSGQVLAAAGSTGLAARFTVEAWARTTSTTGGLVVGLGDQKGASAQDDRLLYVSPDGRVRFGVGAMSKTVVASTNPVNDGRWHHVVGVVDGNGAGNGNNMATLYVDGNAQGSSAKAAVSLTSGYWRVGSEPISGWAGNPTTAALTGDVDEVAVYNSPLTSTRVKAHYDTGVAP